MRLIQIVPHDDPGAEGVSALAAAVAECLGGDAGLNVEVVGLRDVGEPGGPPHRSESTSPASVLAKLLGEGLGAGDALLLHYVGYGYDRRGAPGWLPAALEARRRVADRPRIAAVFHEVAAFGPPWRSSFWLAPLQRSIASRLLHLSDAAVTSVPRYRRLLLRLAPEKHVDLLPIVDSADGPAARSRDAADADEERAVARVLQGRGWSRRGRR